MTAEPALSRRRAPESQQECWHIFPVLFQEKASPAEYWAGLQLAIAHGWLTYHESGTFVTMTPTGAEIFA